MARNDKSLTAARSPVRRLKVFGERPLIAGESPDVYDTTLKEVARALDPRDYVDWMYVKDISNLDWDNLRARRAAAGILANARRAARDHLMEYSSPLSRRKAHDAAFLAEVAEAITSLECEQAERREPVAESFKPNIPAPEPSTETLVTETAVTAEAFKQNIDLLAAMEAMLENYELRRSRLLREYELRRARAETPMRLVDPQKRLLGLAPLEKNQRRRRSSSG